MSDTTYNGWTNYETWCVNLHISNVQSEQDYWNERTRFCMDNHPYANNYLDARCELAESLQDTMYEKYEEQKPDNAILADLLRAALSEVNWHEIAQSFVDTVKEEAEQ
jgi:hypothetical protein